MAGPSTSMPLHWVKDPLSQPHSPGSWVFYVVAKVAGCHRPLAVTSLLETDIDMIEGSQLITSCHRTVTCFADPTNRLALASELELAAEFYAEKTNAVLSVFELPELNNRTYRSYFSRDPPDRHMCEFPFTSTCLVLGSSFGSSTGPATPRPLSTVYRDKSPFYGMVVIDITNLEEVRYGIVAFTVLPMVWVEATEEWQRWIMLDQELRGPRKAMVEEERPRRAISAQGFVDKFRLRVLEGVKELEKTPLVEPAAMDLIWPSEGLNSSVTELTKKLRPVKSLGDLAIIALIKSTLETHVFDMSLFNQPRKLRYFQLSLQNLLRENLTHLHHSRSVGQLISLAFDGKSHLALVRYKGLSADCLRGALEREELKSVRSISLCIDALSSTPAEILDALSSSASLKDLYLLQSPTRKSDQLSTDFFLELLKCPHLLRGKVIISGAYSAALSRKFWLPTMKPNQIFAAFPIQHIFYRSQQDSRDPKCFHHEQYYVGDALLAPHHFVAGFLDWLAYSDQFLFALAGGPPNIDDMTRVEVTPIPAEKFCIPQWPRNKNGSVTVDGECWPKTRDLARGSWCVLVSIERHWDRQTHEQNVRRGGWAATEAKYVKFAFVRTKCEIKIHNPPATLGPHDVDVGGLEKFLDYTTEDGGDNAMVRRRLAEVEEKIADWPAQGVLKKGLNWLSVMEAGEAYEVLSGFLRSAVENEENLRLAMREKPEERNWYPELRRNGQDVIQTIE